VRKKKQTRLALVLVTAIALCLPAVSLPARASHRCGLEDVSHTVNTVCDNYHSPKVLVQYVACIATRQCPVS
jgi:hypothetical protein